MTVRLVLLDAKNKIINQISERYAPTSSATDMEKQTKDHIRRVVMDTNEDEICYWSGYQCFVWNE